MQLTKLQFKNLLSFEDITVDLVDNKEKSPEVSRFNLFIGPNNEGKSNILKGIQFAHAVVKALSAYCNKTSSLGNQDNYLWKIESFEEFRKSDLEFLREEQDLFFGQSFEKEIEFSFGFKLNEVELKRVFQKKHGLEYKDNENPFGSVEKKIFEIFGVFKKTGNQYVIDFRNLSFIDLEVGNSDNKPEKKKEIGQRDILKIFNAFFSHVYSNLNDKRILWTAKAFFKEFEGICLKFIPATRKIKEENGNGKIIKILQDFKAGRQEKRKIYSSVERAIHKLAFPDNDPREIDISFPQNILELKVDNIILPLSQLGSGIEQLIYLAAEILIRDNETIFLIEEPETGFHPKLQRAFIRFLQEDLKDRKHQFFITTHSSVFIDPFLQHGDSKVFKVGFNKENNSSHVEDLGDLIQYSKLFYEMGTKGADYLLANGIIWVEGPSDRLYILKWLEIYFELEKKKYKPKEGRDYSFLFYGGSILSSFEVGKEVDDQEIKKEGEEFINLIKISQNIAVIMDRDSTTNKKWKTKKKIEKEISCFPSGYSWITDGKEIENYLTKENIERAYGKGIWKKEFEKNSKEPLKKYLKKEKTLILSNKKEFALKVTETMEIEDLKENRELCKKIAGLYEKIRKWNSL